jgi:hypothetical protein
VRAEDIRFERSERILPRIADVSRSRAMKDDAGGYGGKRLCDDIAIEDVDRLPPRGALRAGRAARPIPADNGRAVREERIDQVTAGETGGPGHENDIGHSARRVPYCA